MHVVHWFTEEAIRFTRKGLHTFKWTSSYCFPLMLYFACCVFMPNLELLPSISVTLNDMQTVLEEMMSDSDTNLNIQLPFHFTFLLVFIIFRVMSDTGNSVLHGHELKTVLLSACK